MSEIKPAEDIVWKIDGDIQSGITTDITPTGPTFRLNSDMKKTIPSDPSKEEDVTIQCAVSDRDGEKTDQQTYQLYCKLFLTLYKGII